MSMRAGSFPQSLGDRPGILVRKNKDLIDLGIQVQIYKRLMVNHDSFISNYYKHVTFSQRPGRLEWRR